MTNCTRINIEQCARLGGACLLMGIGSLLYGRYCKLAGAFSVYEAIHDYAPEVSEKFIDFIAKKH